MHSQFDVVVRGSLRAIDDGYAVDVCASNDDPLPLSRFETVRIAIDGTWAAPAQTTVAIDPVTAVQVADLPAADGIAWAPRRSATLAVHGVARPVPGTSHHVAVELIYRTAADATTADRWVTVETAA